MTVPALVDGGATRKQHKSEIMMISQSVIETAKIALPTSIGGGTTRAARASVEKVRRWRYPRQRDRKDDGTRVGGRLRKEGRLASVARVI